MEEGTGGGRDGVRWFLYRTGQVRGWMEGNTGIGRDGKGHCGVVIYSVGQVRRRKGHWERGDKLGAGWSRAGQGDGTYAGLDR